MRATPLSTVRVIAIVGLLLIVASCRSERQARQASGDDSLNVVLITFCTMRPDKLGAYGENGSSPNIDALAREAVVFEDHYTQAGFSGGAFATMITGKYCANHGVFTHPHRLDGRHETLAEVLGAAGYTTGAFLLHPLVARKWNYEQGFDWPDQSRPSPAGKRQRPKRAARPKALVNDAADWIEENRDRKFFLWLLLRPTHYPYDPPEEFVPAEQRPAFEAFMTKAKRLPAGKVAYDYEMCGFTDDETAAVFAYYNAEVAFADSLAGEIFDKLRELSLWDSTAIVVGADHGETLGEHGLYFNHDTNLYEETLRVPLLLRVPGRPPSRHSGPTRNIDIVPTICELAGVAPPSGIDGVSLIPLLQGDRSDLPVFAESMVLHEERREVPNYPLKIPGIPGKLRAVRVGDYKLIAFPRVEGMRYELYDLFADPGETHDLAGERPEVVARLAATLDEWWSGYGDSAGAPQKLDAEDMEALRSLGYVD